MPLLDVDEAFGVEMLDTFQIVSTEMVIGPGGMPTLTPLPPITAYGIVAPVKAATLRRLGDGSRLDACIDVYTKFPITVGWKTNDVTSRDADIVFWHGRGWTVASVEDFSAYGEGYLHAQCDLTPLNPTVPEPQSL